MTLDTDTLRPSNHPFSLSYVRQTKPDRSPYYIRPDLARLPTDPRANIAPDEHNKLAKLKRGRSI